MVVDPVKADIPEKTSQNLPVPAGNTLPAGASDKDIYKEWRRGKGLFTTSGTLIDKAVKEENLPVVRHLVTSQKKLKGALETAIYNDKTEMFLALVEDAEDLETTDFFGFTYLHFAVLNNSMEIATYLLEKGVNVDCRCKDLKSTPLIYAAQNGKKEFVKLLLDHNADITIEDHKGTTALGHALNKGQAEIANLLGHKQHIAKASEGWSVSKEDDLVTNTVVDKKQNMTIRHIFDFNAKTLITRVNCGDEIPSMTKEDFNAVNKDFIEQATQELQKFRETSQLESPKLV